MAKRPKPLVGLEIDPGAVRAASVGSGLAIKEHAERVLEPGIVRDGEVADVEALAAVLRDLFADAKFDKRVRVGLASQRVLVRPMDLPPIEDAGELDVAVRFHAEDALPMALEGTVLDYVPLGIVDTPDGPRTRVILVAARKEMVGRLLAAVRAAGLRPEGIDLAAFGMVRALSAQAQASAAGDEPVLFLGVGGLTNLAVARGTTCLFTRVVGGGLDALVQELSERRGSTREEARQVVMEHGLEGDEDVASVLADGLRRLAGEVRTTVDFQASGDLGAPVRRCLLTGPALAVPGFVAALERELGMAVEPAVLPGDADARFATAAGLCLDEAPA
jgi:type IV pilus assembly protein PilM